MSPSVLVRVLRATMLFATAFVAVCAPAQDKGAQENAAADVEQTLAAIVRVKAKIQKDARSAATLGVDRDGSGVMVREGYVLTIGYLVIEAESVEVTGADGKTVPATLGGYDHASGFGLLKLLAPLGAKPLPLGDAGALAEREAAVVATFGGREGVSLVHVVSRRPFTGSWEYLLDSAIYTSPPVMNWSGAALINARGELLGLGSLIVADSLGQGVQSPGNMFVPIDLLKPILEDLIAQGRRAGPARPWLGLNAEEMRGRLMVARVSPDGPAARAGLKSGDLVVGVGGEEVSTLAELYRKVWARGAAGVDVPLKVLQGMQIRDVTLRSIDRIEYFRQKTTY
ncbi:MAG TPA: S1C family serine protease [Burkholderiales bacterium]|nr:S1C family serine protease [Burkholderiales bacterium]